MVRKKGFILNGIDFQIKYPTIKEILNQLFFWKIECKVPI